MRKQKDVAAESQVTCKNTNLTPTFCLPQLNLALPHIILLLFHGQMYQSGCEKQNNSSVTQIVNIIIRHSRTKEGEISAVPSVSNQKTNYSNYFLGKWNSLKGDESKKEIRD